MTIINGWHCTFSEPRQAAATPGQTEQTDIGYAPFAFRQMDCLVTSTTTEQLTVEIPPVELEWQGLNRNESLFIFGVFLFFISMMAWKKFSIIEKDL